MYLSKISIKNYKGIKELEVNFTPDINIIIGENGSCKSALIDAIRLLYNLGEPIREIAVSKDDFFEKNVSKDDVNSVEKADLIHISYEFRDLRIEQKGAFYEYMVPDSTNNGKEYARIDLKYELGKHYPIFSYNTGCIEGQKADTNTFQLFQHYYLSALRDSTRDLLRTRNNLLGRVIKRLVDRNESEEEIKGIIKSANEELLKRSEVITTRDSINKNLNSIYKNINRGNIGLQIEQSRIESIVNVIKPFLPHGALDDVNEGFSLWQNSLGFNNLIYIATVLGDIKERIADDPIPHYALLIEEPEAHIHPQLQLNLYNFLKEANSEVKSQLFITTHSPTLTSKVPLDKLILLENNSYNVGGLFANRSQENLVQDTVKRSVLTDEQINEKKQQLERYIDVTKSQLFYARKCLFVEGISEELLISALSKIDGFNLEDYSIELVNVDGVSFYPFMFLFNSPDHQKRLPKRIVILTDDDRYTKSKEKEYSFDNLLSNNYQNLQILDREIQSASPVRRIANLQSIKNNRPDIHIHTSFKTMEYELCMSNVKDSKNDCQDNFLYQYIRKHKPQNIEKIEEFMGTFESEHFNDEQKRKVGLLLWKSVPSKALFAQGIALEITNNLESAKSSFCIPRYILDAFNSLKQ